MTRRATAVAWSGGKDAAWALKRCLEAGGAVDGLLVVVDGATARSTLNGVPVSVLERQARALGLKSWFTVLPDPCSDIDYRRAMRALTDRVKAEGIRSLVSGDVSLPGIREYRHARMRGTGLRPEFPLWGADSHQLASEMISGGLRARISSCPMNPSLVGREFDRAFLRLVGPTVDPLGERGEFHTVVYDAPMFRTAIEPSRLSWLPNGVDAAGGEQ